MFVAAPVVGRQAPLKILSNPWPNMSCLRPQDLHHLPGMMLPSAALPGHSASPVCPLFCAVNNTARQLLEACGYIAGKDGGGGSSSSKGGGGGKGKRR